MNSTDRDRNPVNSANPNGQHSAWRWFFKSILKQVLNSIRSLPKLLFFEEATHRYWAIFIILSLVAVIYYVATFFPIPGAVLKTAGAISVFLIYLIHLLNNQNPEDQVKQKASLSVKIALEVCIAAAISFFLFEIEVIGNPASGKDFMIAFVVAITLLSLQIVSGAAGVTQSLNGATKQLKEAADTTRTSAKEGTENVARISSATERIEGIRNDLSIVSGEVWDVALLSKLLEMERRHLDTDNRAVRNAVDSALDTMRVWVKAGEHLMNNAADDAEVQGNSWWRLMETYNREERYDIGRNEVVTNVRNYAFLILRLIDEHITAVKKDNNGKRVVVAQVTPFAPKDFYNYPNGSSDNRYYFDQEFFGTYRRLLSHYLRCDVDVRRVILCAQPDEDDRKNRDLGWKLDEPAKLYIGCKYMNVLPTAIPISASGHKSNDGDKLLAAQFKKHDPAKRLRENVGVYPWIPVYPKATWYNSITKNGVSDTKRDKLWKALANEEQNRHVEISNGARLVSIGGLQNGGNCFETRELFDQVSAQKDNAWKDLDKAVKDCTGSRNKARISTKFNCLNDLSSIAPGHALRSDELLKIVPIVQEIDALLADGTKMGQSASGQSMGISEIWFYWWLVYLEQEQYARTISGPLPTVWARFKSDVLALDSNGGEDVAKCLKRIRLIPLRSRNHADATRCLRNFSYIEEHGILPEFVLIGIADNLDCAMDKVEWKVFFGSEMSEPFHAARIRFDFARSASGSEGLLEKHKKWLNGLWGNDNDDRVTRSFVEAMEKEDDGGLKAFLDAVNAVP